MCYLINKGADTDVKNATDQTILNYVKEFNYSKIVQLL